MKDIIVLKLGSSTLTAGTSRISRGRIEDIAQQIVALRDDYHLVLVSSGAIATARQFIDQRVWGDRVASKQAMSAIGQPKLMQIYYEVFSDYGINIAQCLLTYRDFHSEVSRTNTLNTIVELLRHDYVPIINENDTVAVDEIVLGDNDQLSAKLATLIQAKTLVLASDIDGLYDKNPHLHADATLIRQVSDFSQVDQFIEEKKGGIGTGGMRSKILAAKICVAQGVQTIIVNGGRPHFLLGALRQEVPCTIFGLNLPSY